MIVLFVVEIKSILENFWQKYTMRCVKVNYLDMLLML